MTAKCPKCNSAQQPDAWICTSCGFNIGLYRKEHGEEFPPSAPAQPQQPQRSGGSSGWGSNPSSGGGKYGGVYGGSSASGRNTQYGRTTSGSVHTYMWEAIGVTLCCNLLFGIVAIIMAAQAAGMAKAGDMAGAEKKANEAKTCLTWGFFIGLVVIGLKLAFGLNLGWNSG